MELLTLQKDIHLRKDTSAEAALASLPGGGQALVQHQL